MKNEMTTEQHAHLHAPLETPDALPGESGGHGTRDNGHAAGDAASHGAAMVHEAGLKPMDHAAHAEDAAGHASPVAQGHGHETHQEPGGHMGHMGNLKRKFFVSLALAVPILFLSPMMGIALPFQIVFPGSDWLVAALATILFFYGGMPFLRGARQELADKSPAMMTLISLGITTAYGYSLYAFFMNRFTGGHGRVMDFFWELATLIVIMLLGHWIEMKAVAGAGDALRTMAELLPATATVRQANGEYAEVPLRDVAVGRLVLVGAGGKIPADGIVREGESSVNESLVTGEARDVPKKSGDKVIGGSLNGAGSILLEVTGTGESGFLARVMRLVDSAGQEKSRAETVSDKVARLLFYVALGAGLLAFAVWFAVTKDFGAALTRMVTVLVIACPHALGLAVPLVTARSTSLGARNGLLVRNRQALEKAPKVNVVMMDKTGTLTEGDFRVTGVVSFDASLEENAVLSMMAGLEAGSSHPLAAGILKEAAARGLRASEVGNVKALPGVGLSGTLADGTAAMIVNAAYLDARGVRYDAAAFRERADKGYSVSFLLLGGKPAGLVALGDAVKPGAAELVNDLTARGVRPVMLTGDNEAAARSVAKQLGLETFRAALMPEDKEKIIREYKEKGNVVMMVGDGINDAPSLARADVGVAIGAGTDVAVDSADVVLVKSEPSDIPHFLSLAENTNRKMIRNLWWGAGYNIIAIPLAAGVLAPAGIMLSPAVGAMLMSLSTVIVAANAMTLKIR